MKLPTGRGLSFSGNTVKLIALIAMTADHIGLILLNENIILRSFGRISFPLFAFLIAEGCRYTGNKRRYFGLIFLTGALCQLMLYVLEKRLYMCIMITFSLSVLIIFSLMRLKSALSAGRGIAAALTAAALIIGASFALTLINYRDFAIDYGFCGIMLAPLVSLSENRRERLPLFAAGLVLLSLSMGGMQWWCLAALPVILLYDGTRGRLRLKYLFYVYYPLHIFILSLISRL